MARKPPKPRKAAVPETQGKRVEFDLETWQTLDVLARERMMTFQELADEAFADLFKKHGIPIDLKDALRKSASVSKAMTQDNAKSGPSRKPKS